MGSGLTRLSGYAIEITEPAVKRILEKIKPSFEFEIIPLFKKDSLDINDDDRKKLLDICRNSEYKKIIITHGTDKMIDTAKYLSVINDKAIIITGAAKPERFKESDAEFNIGFALGSINTLEEGVYVSMNGRIFAFDKVKRDDKFGMFTDIR